MYLPITDSRSKAFMPSSTVPELIHFLRLISDCKVRVATRGLLHLSAARYMSCTGGWFDTCPVQGDGLIHVLYRGMVRNISGEISDIKKANF